VVLSATNDPPARILRYATIQFNGSFYSPDGMAISSDGKSLLINNNEGLLLLADLSNFTLDPWPLQAVVRIPQGGLHGDVGQVGADGCPYFSELNLGFIFKVTPCIFSAGANHVPDVCASPSDCTSANCTNGHCAAVDIPHKCEVDSDCFSQYCFNRTCSLAPVGTNCTAPKYCTSTTCTLGICAANPPNGVCHDDSDCLFNNNCSDLNTCNQSPLGGQCSVDSDCKPPFACDVDHRCKVKVTLSVLNLILVTGVSQVYAIPSEEGLGNHEVQVRVSAPGYPLATGTVKFTELNPTAGPVGTVGTLPDGFNNVSVFLPWKAKAKLGIHSVQMTYSGDGLHFGKNFTVNFVYFYFPPNGRFAISGATALNTAAYFYGSQWQSKNFVVSESGGDNYVGYRTPNLIANDDLHCGSSQSVGHVPDNTVVPSYTWLGVPMVNGSDVRAGTARGVLKFGIIKVNPANLPLPDTGVDGQPAGSGVGNLYATFCSGSPLLR